MQEEAKQLPQVASNLPISSVPRNDKASEKIEMQRASAQVFGALQMAWSNPRSEEKCVERIEKLCSNVHFAGDALYKVPVGGGASAEGLKVQTIKELTRIWGNMDAGFIDHGSYGSETQMEAYAFDLESNYRFTERFTVSHKYKTGDALVEQKDPARIAVMCKARASKEVRNCLQSVLPDWLVDHVKKLCKQTIIQAVGSDLVGAWRGWVKIFQDEYKVGEATLLRFVDKPCVEERGVVKIQAGDIMDLRVLYSTLKEEPDSLDVVFPRVNAAAASPNPKLIAQKEIATELPKKQRSKPAAKDAEQSPEPTASTPAPDATDASNVAPATTEAELPKSESTESLETKTESSVATNAEPRPQTAPSSARKSFFA